MVKMIPQDNLPKKNIAITIKTNYQAGMKPIYIAQLLKVSKQVVNYWIHHPIIEKIRRRTKLTRKEKNLIVRWAKDKPINLVSTKIFRGRVTINIKLKVSGKNRGDRNDGGRL